MIFKTVKSILINFDKSLLSNEYILDSHIIH
jgi:hypothetical protein